MKLSENVKKYLTESIDRHFLVIYDRTHNILSEPGGTVHEKQRSMAKDVKSLGKNLKVSHISELLNKHGLAANHPCSTYYKDLHHALMRVSSGNEHKDHDNVVKKYKMKMETNESIDEVDLSKLSHKQVLDQYDKHYDNLLNSLSKSDFKHQGHEKKLHRYRDELIKRGMMKKVSNESVVDENAYMKTPRDTSHDVKCPDCKGTKVSSVGSNVSTHGIGYFCHKCRDYFSVKLDANDHIIHNA